MDRESIQRMRNKELDESSNESSSIGSSIMTDTESVTATLMLENKVVKAQLAEMKNEMAKSEKHRAENPSKSGNYWK